MAKKAVCIGINNYPGTDNDLRGCVNDADDWAQLLRETYRFDSVDQLKDSRATIAGIKAAMEGLVNGASDGDVLVLTFSGHGTWKYENQINPDESDNRDEALCAHDGDILDDEIREILNGLTTGANLTIISDSCHSGTVTRSALRRERDAAGAGIEAGNASKPRFMPPEDDMDAIRAMMLPVKHRAFYPEHGMHELLLTGCNALEYSYDAYLNGRFNGAMTAFAIQIIRSDPSMTYRQLHQKLRQFLPSSQFPQRPQLEGGDVLKDRQLFT